MSPPVSFDPNLQPPAGGVYADGMCLPEEDVVKSSSGEGESQARAAANHHKFTSVIAGTSRSSSAVKPDPAKITRARGFEMTAHVLDFSKQLSPDQLVCKEDQDATLALLDHLPIGDFEILTPPSLLKGHFARLQGLNKIAALTLPEDLEVKQAGVGGLVVLIISLILAACSDNEKEAAATSDTTESKADDTEPKTTFTVGCSGDFDSLQDAVDSVKSGSTLNLCSGVFNETVYIDNKDLSIIGDPSGTVMKGDGENGILHVANSKITVKGINFNSGISKLSVTGNISLDQSEADFKDCNFVNNTNTLNSCGAVSTRKSTLTITDSTFANNIAQFVGGALCVHDNSFLSTNNVLFDSNESHDSGGAISIQTSGMSLLATSFYNNSSGEGGAIDMSHSKNSTGEDLEFKNNSTKVGSAYAQGGSALHILDSYLKIGAGTDPKTTIFEDNSGIDIVVAHDSSLHLQSLTEGVYHQFRGWNKSNYSDGYLKIYGHSSAALSRIKFCNPPEEKKHIALYTYENKGSSLSIQHSEASDCAENGDAIDGVTVYTDNEKFTFGAISGGDLLTCNSTDGCNFLAEPVCEPHATQKCSGNSKYWADSCGNLEEIYDACNDPGEIGCIDNKCVTGECIHDSDCPDPSGQDIKCMWSGPSKNDTTCKTEFTSWEHCLPDLINMYNNSNGGCGDNMECMQIPSCPDDDEYRCLKTCNSDETCENEGLLQGCDSAYHYCQPYTHDFSESYIGKLCH